MNYTDLRVVLIILFFVGNLKTDAIQVDKNVMLTYEKTMKSFYENPDSTSARLTSILKANPNIQDTIAQLVYYQLNRVERFRQHFAHGFEYTDKALHISERINDSNMISLLSQDLGDYYTEFGKEQIAKKNLLRGLEISKAQYQAGQANSHRVTAGHFHLAKHYRHFGHLQLALVHLDSCEIIGNINHHVPIYNAYHRAEQARIYTELGHVDTAQIILKELDADITALLETDQINYDLKGLLTVINLYYGDAFLKEKRYAAAAKCYHKATQINARFKRYNTLQGTIFEHLANAEFELRHYKSAYLALQKAKILGDENFGISSKQNTSLIEVRSKDRKQLEAQHIELLEKSKLVAEQAKSLWLVRVVLAGFILLVIISLLAYRNYMQKQRFKKDQEESTARQKEADETLALKNKELTAYTLKLIDKDKTIGELLLKLKEGKTDPSAVKAIEKSIQQASKALWEDFNSRFIAVNSDFYKRLQQKFPDLSKTERKHCALIKLNFSGKEMAHLLGISVTSVHVSRYRLRKRFALEKHQNLTDYIARI